MVHWVSYKVRENPVPLVPDDGFSFFSGHSDLPIIYQPKTPKTMAIRCFLGVMLLTVVYKLPAQMVTGSDTLYGHEWIDYDRTYYKFSVAEDGLYRLTYQTLRQAGIPVDALTGDQYQLWCLGEEIPLFVSSGSSSLQPGDFLEFFGHRHRNELDRWLFDEPEEGLNPWYSLVTDSTAYFLTWTEGVANTKRIVAASDMPSAPPEPEEWYWATKTTFFQETLTKQATKLVYNHSRNALDLYYSRYQSDGFSKGFQTDQSVQLSDLHPAPVALSATMHLRLLSNANLPEVGHDLQVSLADQVIFRDTFTGSRLLKINRQLSTAEIDRKLNLRVWGSRRNDTYSIGGLQLRYPAHFSADLKGPELIELAPKAGVRRLQWDRVQSDSLLLYDLDRRERQVIYRQQGRHDGVVGPNSDETPHRIWVAHRARIISRLSPKSFTPLASEDANYLIIAADGLQATHLTKDWVAAYAQYRSSPAGGGYQVVVVSPAALYDQFGYGLRHHPVAIRNAVHYLDRAWSGLQYVFLMGKGQEYPSVRRAEDRQRAEAHGLMGIPSFGFPASDQLLVSPPGGRIPTVPIGRLAATHPDEVRIYLEKIRAVEAQQNNPQTISQRGWMKRIIHLGGGGPIGEQALLRSNLESMARLAEHNGFGAHIDAFYKNSSTPLETSRTEAIFSAINAGSSLITFFGHSSPGTFDFNIDNPDQYDNYARYPLVLSLGCYSGNIFTESRSIGERFTLYEDRAAIAFVASRGIGFVFSLSELGSHFYEAMGGAHYGAGIGDILKAALTPLEASDFIGTATMVEQFTLHGDPAFRLHPAAGPDFTIDPGSVHFLPATVRTSLDSFSLGLDILNIGRNLPTNLPVLIEQELPDGSRRTIHTDTVFVAGYRTQISWSLPVTGPEMVGKNRYFVQLDPNQQCEERPAEAVHNNALNDGQGVPLFVVDHTARPVWPPDRSVVGTADITLWASTTEPLAAVRTYQIQLDTTPLFRSPYLQEKVLRQSGGLISWSPNLDWQEGTTYYWRISPAPSEQYPRYLWAGSSFTYRSGHSGGWSQSHWGQWGAGELQGVVVDTPAQTLTFAPALWDFFIRVKTRDGANPPQGEINGNRWSDFFRWETPQSLNVVVFLPNGQMMWNARPGQYGSLNRTARKEIACFPFPVETPQQRAKIIHFLAQVIPDGATVFLYTALQDNQYDLAVDQWAEDASRNQYGNNLFQALAEVGAQKFRQLEERIRPYLLVFRKGGPVLFEEIGEDITSVITYSRQIPTFRQEGWYWSPIVGPARRWSALRIDLQPSEPEDSTLLQLYGLPSDGSAQTLIEELPPRQMIESKPQWQAYPYLQLAYFAQDERDLSMPTLHQWQVEAWAANEWAWSPDPSTEQIDTLQEGADWIIRAGYRQLSFEAPDTTYVTFILRNANYEILELGIDTVTSEIYSRSFSTTGRSGRLHLELILNPQPKLPETHRFNNILVQEVLVVEDQRPPMLQVYIDGRVVPDGALVSAQPVIHITLIDDNPYLLLQDSSLLRVTLIDPEGREQPITGGEHRVRFIPAQDGANNQLSLEIIANLAQSGVYTLRVRARDSSGNSSGRVAFEKRFEVIQETTISDVVPFPNPFSQQTRWVYTLTGSVPPSELTIRIMTIRGQVVRDIRLHEQENLQIGTHHSHFIWDGTDDFGDRLANGIYLYQVIAKDHRGNRIPWRSSGMNTYLKKGIGKVVILR